MYYTTQEVLSYVSQEDVKFIRLAFFDIYGCPKNISISPEELPRAFEKGISFDASAIQGFGSAAHSDLFLVPDPCTLSVLPWRPAHGKVVRMYCDIKTPGGGDFTLDARQLLRRAVHRAAKLGLMCYISSELEFYLFKTDEQGEPTRIPFDRAGYMDIAPEDAGENIRREICLTLEEMGIRTEASHHEEGPGQNEIDFRYSDPLCAADNTATFKQVVKTAAARNGLYASFNPKPLAGKSGSGMHVNLSVSALPAGAAKDKTAQSLMDSFLAGILAHISEITLFLNPCAASYQRLGAYKAPKAINWSKENRTVLVRIPAETDERSRMELRSPDPRSNPYLCYAAILYAGMDGVEKAMTPPPAAEFCGEAARFETLPESLEAAAACMRQSEFVRSLFPQQVIDAYLCLPQTEKAAQKDTR